MKNQTGHPNSFNLLFCLGLLLIFLNPKIGSANENSYLHFGFDINFEVGSSDILKNDAQDLKSFATLLMKNPKVQVHLFGYSDLTANSKNNQKIAKERVDQIKILLIDNGINPRKIITSTLKEFEPILKNKKVYGQNSNRRIVVRFENINLSEIKKFISWSENRKGIYIVDPVGNKIKNLTLLTQMFESQSDELDNQNRLPASKK